MVEALIVGDGVEDDPADLAAGQATQGLEEHVGLGAGEADLDGALGTALAQGLAHNLEQLILIGQRQLERDGRGFHDGRQLFAVIDQDEVAGVLLVVRHQIAQQSQRAFVLEMPGNIQHGRHPGLGLHCQPAKGGGGVFSVADGGQVRQQAIGHARG